ncbi:hypothetical protein [Azospirillum largimobile]
MRDQFNFSGDFRGAVVNIQSQLGQASQNAASLPGDASDRAQLVALLSALSGELQKLPAPEQAAAALIAARTEELVAAAATPSPDRSRLRQLGDAIGGGIKLLGNAGPGVAETAEKIVTLVARLVG